MSHDQSEEDELWRAAGRESASQAAGMALAAYERSVIAHIFKLGGPVDGMSRLASRIREETGVPNINLWAFSAYADFPLRLAAAKLKLVDMPMGDLFKRPTATPIHQAYIDVTEEYPVEQATALVFRWKGFGERMVLHTLVRDFAEPGKASRTKIVYAVGRPKLPPTIYTVEDLDGLLEAIGWMRPNEERTLHVPRKRDVRRGGRERPRY